LRNEKYKGEALLQKTFCENFLTKKMVKNEGQVPQYYVENSHPEIISPELFELVQQELEQNSRLAQGRSNASCFSGKIFCGECGETFNSRTGHSQDAYKRRVWQCSGKYQERGNVKCRTPHLSDGQLKSAFLLAFNGILGDKDRYLAALNPAIELLTNTADLEKETQILTERHTGLYSQLKDLVENNARQSRDHGEFLTQYEDLSGRYEAVKARLEEIATMRQSRMAKREELQRYCDTLRSREALITEFDEGLWRATVENVTVHSLQDVRVKVRDGREVQVNIGR
jgi:hypothetical protein